MQILRNSLSAALAVLALTSACAVWAGENDYYVIDYSKVDNAKWCSYANQIYSRGAVIEIGGRAYTCVQESENGPGANRLVWRKLDK